ncbi:MAG: uracil-DNA glycosylase [Thiobacillus sp.]|nr:uracil-DNA glycosylase [Thiobacillus sp.]
MTTRPRPSPCFDLACRACPRLATFLDEVHVRHPTYHARPVPAFGDPQPDLLIVGLAPGMHGANRSGRPFTGDTAGILLYQTLHQFGYASAPESVSVDDGLQLPGCRITNAVKCLPPANKPEPGEIRECNRFLAAEISELPARTTILALGQIAHQAVLRAQGLKIRDYPFAHASDYRLPSGRRLVSSYHCSRYNTQTRRLTPEMFAAVFSLIQNKPIKSKE